MGVDVEVDIVDGVVEFDVDVDDVLVDLLCADGVDGVGVVVDVDVVDDVVGGDDVVVRVVCAFGVDCDVIGVVDGVVVDGVVIHVRGCVVDVVC